MDSSNSGMAPTSSARMYTPAMLAELLAVSVARVRSWQRRGLIQPREIRDGVPYFDFSQLVAGRQLSRLLGQGLSTGSVEQKLRRLADWFPDVDLGQMSLTVDGDELLLRHEGQILESGGQKRFDFDEESISSAEDPPPTEVIPLRLFATELSETGGDLPHPDDGYRMKALAEQLEDSGEIEEAIEAWRTFHLACGPRADSCFRLGELLYLTGDYRGARERYYMALEMDPNRVEVRASLGCVLVELGEYELAISALRGALEYQPTYPDVHYHLAGALELTGRHAEARTSWETFLQLSPEGPWAEQARQALQSHVRAPQPR